ncbi:S-protein homolog 2-like [Neltuma alba]|uniref:S-protein homolog 2-like n=1 Tax=Neltuma alba TaxID=207710 RepID=UPI0010A316A7|nr:S-protein homolog 2-like [Prosopis alba]XP_028785459.1 S-protein homolog 2-like [Prosopis alba]
MSQMLKPIIILVLSSVLVLAPHLVEADTHLSVNNYLYNSLELLLHCQSKDDDLGRHLLHPKESFKFRFNPNLWGTTLYYCSFQWPGAVKWFNIYEDGRDSSNCDDGKCIWIIKQDGPCQVNAPGYGVICYPWKGE